MSQSQQGYARVTVDTRALIDKVLARYSGEFTVFRELLQNSDDAGCEAAEIHFETTAFLCLGPKAAMNTDPRGVPDFRTTNVSQWTFRNYGKPFAPQDWDRLPRIALGNPDPQKVGAFGVGFYSLFSVTESPSVSSGDKEMEFSWDDEDQLHYRFGDLPESENRDLWTTFKIPLREASPMPVISEFMQFLTSSITFMVHLKNVAVFFDRNLVGQVIKSLGQPCTVPIPTELGRLSPERNMFVGSVQQSSVTIEAGVMLDSLQMHKTRVDFSVFTAEVDVTVDKNLSKELNRCTKKNPPSCVKYSLIYTSKDGYDQSRRDEQKHKFPSPFRELRADLDGATRTRVFIGHATAQTTGIGGHMASCFIPTVERESIDLVDKDIAVWNRELLYVGGFLCRVVYELEVSKIQSSWEQATRSSFLSRRSQYQLHERFLHAFKFFTFHHSTPSSKVSQLLADSFYGCSTLPLRLLSSVGVLKAPDTRAFDPVFAQFLTSLPMLSEYVTQHGAHCIAALPGQHKVPPITLSDILQDLRCHPLDVKELLACLRWWITSGRDKTGSNLAELLDAATFRSTIGIVRLSSITHFIDPKVLGLHIPLNGPLPLFVIPPDASKHFSHKELAGFGWKAFTVISWLQHISQPDVMSADKKYDLTRSIDWASGVLRTLCHLWPQLSDDMRNESKKVFWSMPCIPTCKGLHLPEESYFPVAGDALFHNLDLPIVGHGSRFIVDEGMKKLLLFIGVRTNPPIRFLLHQMLSTGDGAVFDLLDYLIKEELSLTSEDLDAVRSSRIFMKESSQSNDEENTCHRADELYPPVNVFRRFRLPVIEWNGRSEWKETSAAAKLLYRLGLNQFPPLPKIVELCSSRNVGVRETAFDYLCSKLHSQYSNYRPEDFLDTEFIPAESNDRVCLKKPREVYSCIQWKALGFFVVPDQYLSIPLLQLGVIQHPSVSSLLYLLEKTPPSDKKTASRWFEVLFDHMEIFSPPDLIKLSVLPIVLTGPSSSPKLLPPTKCYLEQGTKPALHAKLFVFVNFSPKANRFLAACGSKNKVSIEDVAEALIDGPERFFELAGGYEGFLIELRKFAFHIQDISNTTMHKMSHKPTLLGVRRKKTEDGTGWDYEHQFLTYQSVVIVDDINDYQLFCDHLFVAPQEEALEQFYASLGCSFLSAVVNERCDALREVSATKTCAEVQSLILERLPLFIQKYSDAKPKVAIPCSTKDLKVKACKRIRVSKTLVTGNVERTSDVWAIARHEDGCMGMWISTTAKRDMFEVATSLCRLMFGRSKMNATLLLETILSADLEILERRGFIVARIPQQHKNDCDAGDKPRQTLSAGSGLTTGMNPRQPTQVVQPDPLMNCEKLPGEPEAGLRLPHASATNSIRLKLGEVSNASTDNSLDIDRQSIPVSVMRTSREVIPQSYIRNNVEKAVRACGHGGGDLPMHMRVDQFLSSGFCTTSPDLRSLYPIGKSKEIVVCVDEGMPDADTFMERLHGPLSRFVDIIIPLSGVYHISPAVLRIFYDVSGGCIAFNCQGIIYLNLRYFEIWHDGQVKSGNRQSAQISWFFVLAHEIAHNLIDMHNSDHEFWFSAICEAHLVAFSHLLRPSNASSRSVSLWFILISTVVVLFAYSVKRIVW